MLSVEQATVFQQKIEGRGESLTAPRDFFHSECPKNSGTTPVLFATEPPAVHAHLRYPLVI
jgi:hypothetical protein